MIHVREVLEADARESVAKTPHATKQRVMTAATPNTTLSVPPGRSARSAGGSPGRGCSSGVVTPGLLKLLLPVTVSGLHPVSRYPLL
jgi:hypothetical protein